jgi:hypothetical protein
LLISQAGAWGTITLSGQVDSQRTEAHP